MKKAVLASGCFWGTQHYLDKLHGVVRTVVGYTGGRADAPTYEQVTGGGTGHVEAVEVTYDPRKLSYEKLLKYFFETHDPTQKDGQGPDLGPQYRSMVFYETDEEKEVAKRLIQELKDKGIVVATRIAPAKKFWQAEDYHQEYYMKTGGTPYCHTYRKLFD